MDAEEKDSKSEPMKEPAIRTMKSDMAEFLSRTKPSLISILARQVKKDEARQGYSAETKPGLWLWLAAAGVVILGLSILLIFFNPFIKEPPPQPPGHLPAPAPAFFFENSEEITISREPAKFINSLENIGTRAEATGTFRRIVFRISAGDKTNPVLSSSQFFELIGANPPQKLLETAVKSPQFFTYQQNSGLHFGVILETGDPDRSLGALRAWEASLQSELDALFFGRPPRASLEPFKDLIYRNTDYRFLKRDPAADIGIGYLYFPAKRLIIISTSEETLKLAINRLFESR